MLSSLLPHVLLHAGSLLMMLLVVSLQLHLCLVPLIITFLLQQLLLMLLLLCFAFLLD